MRDDLGPQGALEETFADRVVNLAWRLRRAERLESTAWGMIEDQQVTRGTDKAAAGSDPDEREAALARAVVEDFRYGKVLDRLLGYERRIENSLYRTMNELRKTRLLRQVEEGAEEVSSGEFRVSSEERQSTGFPSLPTSSLPLPTATEMACGATTNGGESEDELRQTKPMEVSSGKCEVSSEQSQAPGAASLPTANLPLVTLSETPYGVTTNGAQADGLCCETKPTEVSSGKCEVSSKESQLPGAPGLPTSNLTLQTPSELCQATSEPG
jgi:hypothetical protein